MRRFARVELGDEVVPDESTILRFRHLLEQHRLTEGIFAEIQRLLEARRLLLRSGTIVDATIIAFLLIAIAWQRTTQGEWPADASGALSRIHIRQTTHSPRQPPSIRRADTQ